MKKITLLIAAVLSYGGLQAQQNCLNAIPVAVGTHFSPTMQAGNQLPQPVCTSGQQNSPTVGSWFKYTATQQRTVIVTTNVPGYQNIDTRVHVYKGGCSNLMCIAGDDDSGGAGFTSKVNFPVAPGETYYIAFDNNWTTSSFTFKLTEEVYQPQIFAPQAITLGGQYRICVADMNGDYLDDIVSVDNGNLHIRYQKADGTGFDTATVSIPSNAFQPSWSMAAGDFNGDGYNDLLLGGGSGASLVLSNGSGGFGSITNTPIYVFSQRTNFVDINNDGKLDAFICHDVAPNVFFLNNGTSVAPTFQQGGLGDVSNGGNYGSIWVDYDNDGDQDLFIAKCRGGSSTASIDELHRNNGNGTFTNVAATAGFADFHQSWSSAWADFDNDGDMDVMVGASSNSGGGHKLMRNNGDGTFTNVTTGSGFDAFGQMNIEHVAHDFNNDGWVDVFTGGSTIMLNNGNMTFTPKSVSAGNGPVGDLNNDGFLDVLNGSTIQMNSGNTNNWTKIHLKGTISNRNGIGARVEIYGTWGKQIRDVRSGDGFEFMSSLNTHFGIGAATVIDKIVVKWPSGTVDTLLNPSINQPILVTEGTTLGNEDFLSSQFTIFPNPAKDIVEIGGEKKGEITKATIYDLNGRLVKTVDVANAAINVQALAKGSYILKLQDESNRQYTKKLIKG